MAYRRFSARQDAAGTWTIFDGPVPASFSFHGDVQRIPEGRAMFLVDLLNTLELRRTARLAAQVRRVETVH